jgi:hypothetical protein
MMRGLQASSSFIINRVKKPENQRKKKIEDMQLNIGSRKQARE